LSSKSGASFICPILVLNVDSKADFCLGSQRYRYERQFPSQLSIFHGYRNELRPCPNLLQAHTDRTCYHHHSGTQFIFRTETVIQRVRMNVTAVVNLPRTPFGFTSTLLNDSKSPEGNGTAADQYFRKRMAVAGQLVY